MAGSQAAVSALHGELGAVFTGEGQARFVVWAPFAGSVDVHLFAPEEKMVSLEAAGDGYFHRTIDGLAEGATYKYRLSRAAEFADPASRFQPRGVHGPSAVVSTRFDWQDGGWNGLPQNRYIFYELHVGAFTPEGTFDAALRYLDHLVDLGITAVELMPVAQFPGTRNWGYDGVYPFAVQDSYGGPHGLKRFVDAAHRRGLAVVLDVVYNHLGPEGNYFGQFGPYFTDRYHTPWGPAINFDGEDSAPVRRLVVENALRWIDEFHIDALRLDAVHAIHDESPRHILRELGEAVHARGAELGRQVHLIAESDLNDTRLLEPIEAGGYGLDAQWSDDFHHALHALLTRERTGYYQDYGALEDLAKALAEGFVYTGQMSEYRGRAHGTASLHIPAERFVVCSQNHDQVGNRMLGERFGQLLGFEELKLAAGAVLLSPFLPLLFMGQEYAEPAPFLYFVSHSDAGLIEAVREGRRSEFAAFAWRGEVPDAQAEETFERSRLDHALRTSGNHRVLLELYRELIRLRKEAVALQRLEKDPEGVISMEERNFLALFRRAEGDEILAAYHFGAQPESIPVAATPGGWTRMLDSAEERWAGPGSQVPERLASDGQLLLAMAPKSFCVLRREAAREG
jgi:maltooligosyltrehalose trehalohydrolase